MKKKNLKILVATCIATSLVFSSVTTAFAAETSTVEDPNGTSTTDNKESTPDEASGPAIAVSHEKFLIEQGSEFDLAKALELKVIDKTDGDITDKVKEKLPAIDTTNAGVTKVDITAVNSLKKESTLTVVINIVSFLDTKTVNSLDDAQKVDPKEFVNGKLDDLTVTLGEIDKTKSSIEVIVSDGENELKKSVALVNAEGKPFGDATITPENKEAAQTTAEENLPKTGALVQSSMLPALSLVMFALGYYIAKFKKNLRHE